MIIVASFSVDMPLGFAVTIAVIFHEIPQEIGDFGVLLYAGFTRLRALAYNFVAASLAVLGVCIGYVLLFFDIHLQKFLVPFAAGTFIYIAAADLIPEIHKETKFYRSLISFIIFFVGIVLMYILKILFE